MLCLAELGNKAPVRKKVVVVEPWKDSNAFDMVFIYSLLTSVTDKISDRILNFPALNFMPNMLYKVL